jgi:hypothetical protein
LLPSLEKVLEVLIHPPLLGVTVSFRSYDPDKRITSLVGKVVQPLLCKTDMSVVLMFKSGSDPHMIKLLKVN